MPDSTPKARRHMSDADFKRSQEVMGLIGHLACGIDWDAYIGTVLFAESIGPVLNPTLFLDSPHTLREATTELAQKCRAVAAAYAKCREIGCQPE